MNSADLPGDLVLLGQDSTHVPQAVDADAVDVRVTESQAQLLFELPFAGFHHENVGDVIQQRLEVVDGKRPHSDGLE